MTPAEVIREARALLFERGWTQYALETPAGELCLIGALRTARWKDEYDVLCRPPSKRALPPGLRRILADAGLPYKHIEHWNDERERTFSEVIDVLDRAEKLAEVGADS